MNERNIGQLLRQLAAEPATDRHDPWPAIRARLPRRHPPRSAGLRSVPRLAWGAAAAAVVIVAIGGAAVLDAARPKSATAAEILDRMQYEAQGSVMMASDSAADCEPIVNPTELTDRVGQILGVSGDRVREAMRIQTIQVAPPPGASGGPGAGFGIEPIAVSIGGPAAAGAAPQAGVPVPAGVALEGRGPLPDPMARLSERLGVSREQIHQAFADPACPARIMIPFPGSSSDAQYQRAAQRLGITAQQLADAGRATAPLAPPGVPGTERAPVSPDQLIQRIATELGVTPEQFRAALAQAGGSAGSRGPDFFLPLPR